MKICIGTPTNRLLRPKTVKSLMDVLASTSKWHKNYKFEIVVSTRGFNTSENRNYIAAQAVKRGCDYLFFVDDDMILPFQTLEVLMAMDKDIIGGVYKTKYEVQADVAEYFDDKREDLMKVKAVGTGCLLIKTGVFKKLPQPWFKYEWNSNGSIKRSHDWIFCEDARNAGYDVWVDRTLDVKHIGQKTY